jgi:flavodoxin
MDKKKIVKRIGIAVDALMYVIMLVQMIYVFTGNILHEILGIGFFVCLIAHLIIKRKFLLSLYKFRNKSASRKIANIVTILLTLCSVVMMLSSMGVSRSLFPWFRYMGYVELHVYLATAVLTLAVFHGGMHGYMRAKKKKRAGILIALGCIASIAVGLALVPYLDRHFKVVSVEYEKVISGEKVEWKGTKPLVVYFTRIGNTDFDDDVDAVSGASLLLSDGELMGSNQLIADMIADAVECDVKAITLTGEKYPSSYGSTVSVAGKELRNKARPAVEPIDTSGYDSVILVYPLWWGTVPMPVATFLEGSDLSGKELYLIATQGSSGYGSSVEDIETMAKGADIHKIMSIYCDDIPQSRQRIVNWLKEMN